MTINKFTNNLDSAAQHSSHFADAANAGGFGVVSPQTFTQRMNIDNNRQAVRRYGDSLIAYGQHRQDILQRPSSTSGTPGRPSALGVPSVRQRSELRQRPGYSSGSGIARSAQRPGFTKPPTRSYNPYQ
jgi:hypothetical protein